MEYQDWKWPVAAEKYILLKEGLYMTMCVYVIHKYTDHSSV